jgi:hypothetical protein
MKQTEQIDKLFLELSQFTSARTERELKLAEVLRNLMAHWGDNIEDCPAALEAWDKAVIAADCMPKMERGESALTEQQEKRLEKWLITQPLFESKSLTDEQIVANLKSVAEGLDSQIKRTEYRKRPTLHLQSIKINVNAVLLTMEQREAAKLTATPLGGRAVKNAEFCICEGKDTGTQNCGCGLGQCLKGLVF